MPTVAKQKEVLVSPAWLLLTEFFDRFRGSLSPKGKKETALELKVPGQLQTFSQTTSVCM